MAETGSLGVARGAALYVGALVGPGVLLVPALAAQAAGPASILAWAGLLALSAPLAVAFAALGVKHPVAGGVAAYVREGFGEAAAAATGACFLAAVVLGAPAVSLIGGYYVADLTGSGVAVAAGIGLSMFAVVLAANAFGLRVSSGLQLGLSAVLVAVIAVAVAVALPARAGRWTPFAPHGLAAVGSAASILMWLFFGWEAVAQLAGEFRDPGRQLPRAMGLAFAVIAALYGGLAVATVAVASARVSRVPLADLVAVGFGRAGRDATAVLALALTMGTMNVYLGGSARLAAALAQDGALPRWLGAGAPRSVPRRPLVALALLGGALLAALAAGLAGTTGLVRATSACFVVVYLLALGSAVRILHGRARSAAAVALVLVAVVAAFTAAYLLVPAAAALLALAVRAAALRRRSGVARLAGEEVPDRPRGVEGAARPSEQGPR